MPRYHHECALPDGVRLGLWRLDESADDLRGMIFHCLQDPEKELYATFRSDRRCREWLATRLLIKDMLGAYSPVRYDANGKPFLGPCGNACISISHTDGMVAVLMSDGGIQAAVDIERIAPRISRIKDKFLTPSEIERIPEDRMLECLYIHWCAKEAMYKAYNIADYDYQNSYAIESLDCIQPKYSGRVKADGLMRRFNIYNPDVPGYVVCVAVLI